MYDSDADLPTDCDCTRRQTLSSEELETLAIVATGRSTKEVAAILRYSPEQARHILGRAIIKLDTRSKLEAVVVAIRSGLIKLPNDAEIRLRHRPRH